MEKNERFRNEFSASTEYNMMERLTSLYVRLARWPGSVRRGQTMSEYALILAAVALVVFVFYQTMGQTIEGMVEWGTIHNDLLSS
jgi:Flp pilus assembly pilin Flp